MHCTRFDRNAHHFVLRDAKKMMFFGLSGSEFNSAAPEYDSLVLSRSILSCGTMNVFCVCAQRSMEQITEACWCLSVMHLMH